MGIVAQNGSEGRAHPGLVCEEKWPANDSQRQTNEEREETFAGSIKDSMGRRKNEKKYLLFLAFQSEDSMDSGMARMALHVALRLGD